MTCKIYRRFFRVSVERVYSAANVDAIEWDGLLFDFYFQGGSTRNELITQLREPSKIFAGLNTAEFRRLYRVESLAVRIDCQSLGER